MQRFDRFPLIATAAVATALLASPPPQAVADVPSSFRTDAAQSGATIDKRVRPQTAPESDPIVGDDIASHPGMPGFPKYDPPTTIEVVRPERTIVRDVDEVLPLILSGTALMLALAGLGVALIGGGMQPRPRRSG